jgi:hypothetical protein
LLRRGYREVDRGGEVVAGYRILRIRELPLSPISETDIVVPANPDPHETVAAVLRRILELGYLPESASGTVEVYARSGALVASAHAEEMIARYEHRQARKREP